MRLILLIIVAVFLSNCNKPKIVLICGDHICINKSEAEQYFNDNLTLEAKIIRNKKTKDDIDLVELNLKESENGKRKVNISKKNKINKDLRTLSSKEVINIKRKLKGNKKEKKSNSNKMIKKNVNKKRNDVVDICTILEKCSIDEISKYLIEQGKKKKYPDLTIRQ